ncbi:ATP-sensitive inward rectifier potassium channel 8-like [Sitodiplosis mosellana]|uniref:ATP-sensitive inward rectifier potassium channel 8-like n=1 Tax=Sitodiplosis mosellana TaxID=263140 RepID=UPI00244476AC|nr:ATP-sensitive inward rectifier potassium channel 8-like [Sitodiplosis mosellana]
MEVNCAQNGRRPQKYRRIISKFGERNIKFINLPQRSKRYIQDFITTIIETRWRIVIVAFLIADFGCWTFFAVLWYLISYSHDDLTYDDITGMSLHEGEMTCIRGVKSLTDYFLYSFEIQTTVGFGERYPNEECPEGVFLFAMQIVCGIAIDGVLIGIIYAKLSRPPSKPYHSKFSRKAVICQRDSQLCWMFRICDPNGSHIIGSTIQACLYGEVTSNEGDIFEHFQYPLKLHDEGQVHIIFPVIVCHVIDNSSPLYTLSASQLLTKRFEIIVTLTGASSSTGQTTEERTSYLSNEIMWGHRFVNIVRYVTENEEYSIDYDEFETTEEVDTPLCSAQRFDRLCAKVKSHLSEKWDSSDA